MLTQEQINEDWSVRSDNYNRYVEEEFAVKDSRCRLRTGILFRTAL